MPAEDQWLQAHGAGRGGGTTSKEEEEGLVSRYDGIWGMLFTLLGRIHLVLGWLCQLLEQGLFDYTFLGG